MYCILKTRSVSLLTLVLWLWFGSSAVQAQATSLAFLSNGVFSTTLDVDIAGVYAPQQDCSASAQPIHRNLFPE